MESEMWNVTENSSEAKEKIVNAERDGRNWLGLLPVFLLVVIVVLRVSWTLYRSFGQKTRNPQQRRMYVGSRPRQSLPSPEPSIYLSPSNLPPPPKYECMAPPSYEEVVGIHYPQYQIQPISQPINAALAQGPSSTQHDNVINHIPNNVTNNVASSDVLTTVDETTPVSITDTTEPRRTSITVARP